MRSEASQLDHVEHDRKQCGESALSGATRPPVWADVPAAVAQAKQTGFDWHGLLGQQTSMPPWGKGVNRAQLTALLHFGSCESITAGDFRMYSGTREML